jgi:transposase
MQQDWKTARRMRAYELKQAGWKQQRVAEALGVSKMAVSQWMTTAATQGITGLQARARPGAPRRLRDEQLHLLPDFLSHGAEAYGFGGEVWTCARVGKVIEQEFKVTYDKSQVSRLLKRLNWTPQKPVERASQRNEAAIDHWRNEVWGELKKRRIMSVASLFSWMNRAFTCCQGVFELTHRVVKHRSCVCFTRGITCLS